MFTKSVNFYGGNAYSSAVPTANGGLKTATVGGSGYMTIAATGNATDDYILKRVELDTTTGNGAWSGSVPTGISGAGLSEIILQVDVTVAAAAGSGLSSGQRLNVYYAFATDDLLTTDNSGNRTTARKILLPSAKLIPFTLPAVSAGTSERRVLNTDKITVRGEFLYVWVEHGNIDFNGTTGTNTVTIQVNAVA